MLTESRMHRRERGFSMIEISVVLLIISVVAAFTIPQVVAYMKMYRLGVGGRDVATALQRARYLATSNNTRAGVTVAELRRVDIEQYDALGTADPQYKGSINLPTGVTVALDAPKQIAFDGRGVVTPLPKESPTIRLNGSDGYYLFVIVSPTGQVTVSDARHDDQTMTSGNSN